MVDLEVRPATLDAEVLLRQAVESWGLQDYGDPEFEPVLRRLLRACAEEARLNAAGRRMVRMQVLRHLRNRLFVQAYLAANPEVRQRPLQPPLVITGIPRTGTTLLHNLLALDRVNQFLPLWQALWPVPDDATGRPNQEALVEDAARWARLIYGLSPELRAIHPHEPLGPEECDQLLGADFVGQHMRYQFHVPGFGTHIDGLDQRSQYRRFADNLRALSRTDGGTWVLKSPDHLRHVDELIDVFDDVLIVQCHRPPAEAVASQASLVTAYRKPFTDTRSLPDIGRETLDTWARAMATGLASRDRAGEERFFDVSYHDLTHEPLRTVSTLYERVGRAVTPAFASAMRAWLASHPQHQGGRHEYSLEAFGLTEPQVAAAFAGYGERFAAHLAQ